MSAPGTALISTKKAETQPELQVQRQQDIANLAYALWQQRGCPQGSSEQDWIEAERRLQSEEASTLIPR